MSISVLVRPPSTCQFSRLEVAHVSVLVGNGLAFGCAGGQSGGEGRPSPSCTGDVSAIAWNETSEAGLSAAEAADAIREPFEAQVLWLSNGSTTGATISLDTSEELAFYIDQDQGGDPCQPVLILNAMLQLTTADGSLKEHVPSQVTFHDASLASVSASISRNDIEGSYDPVVSGFSSGADDQLIVLLYLSGNSVGGTLSIAGGDPSSLPAELASFQRERSQ